MKKIIISIVSALIIMSFLIISNKFYISYEDLNETDKTILSELSDFLKQNKEHSIWNNYNLNEKTIVALNKTFGKAYIINPINEINSIFATKIKMPEDKNIEVYRVSILDPELLKIRLDFGNFNTIDKKYNIYGSDVYYTKYDYKKSIKQKNTSRHYITFLSHEAFHYYMQENWYGVSRFNEDLSNEDIELISSEYEVLSNIELEVQKEKPSKELLIDYASSYVDIVKKRIVLNPEYLNNELSMETIEGTANYVSIKASDMVNYDYGVLYFDNTSDVTFRDVIPMLKLGKIDNSFLSNRMPYETGALLCELADTLEINGWQAKLNSQTLDNPVFIYNIIDEYLDK